MKMKTFWLLVVIYAWFGRDGARGQQKQPVSSLQEDCGVVFSFTTASSGIQAAGTTTAGSTGTTSVIDNRNAGCLDWLVTYEPTSAVATVTLRFQTALDVAGIPTTWSNYPGTIVSGINPNTAVTTGGAVTEATGTAYPFLRMNMTVLTGGGTIKGKLYGWKRRPSYISLSGICPGTIATPCVVVGPGADGAAVVGSPVRIGGKDSTGTTQDLITDNGGVLQLLHTLAGVDGFSNASLGILFGNAGGDRLLQIAPYIFNGSTWDRQFVCPNQVMVTLTDATLTALVAVSGTTIVRACQIHATTSGAPETFTITQGTGVACAGAPATIDSYVGVLGFTTDYTARGALRTSASNGLCVSQSGAAQTAVVWVSYAQF